MKLYWKNETGGESSQAYILKRQTPTLRPFLPLHSHDYAELIYVERGSAVHQVEGSETRIGKGDVLFIYPEVVQHCYRKYDQHFSLLQILFPQESFQFIRQRYRSAVSLFSEYAESDPFATLGAMQQIWFERNFDRLLVNERSLIEIERFLLNFIGLVTEANAARQTVTVHWLDRALREIQEPANFRKGTVGFVGLCNRCAEHVEREVKKRTGRTVTDVVNQARMAWAAYMLIFSDMNIVDISYGCGLESTSYFYRLFHEHYGISPARYRKRAEKTTTTFGGTPFVPFQWSDIPLSFK